MFGGAVLAQRDEGCGYVPSETFTIWSGGVFVELPPRYSNEDETADINREFICGTGIYPNTESSHTEI